MRFVHISFAFGLLLLLVDAFWRMPCDNYNGTYRLDPIMSPGQLSAHAHTLHGGSGFTWNATTDSLLQSTATTCGVAQDKSAYWAPPLVFQHEDGTIEGVPQVGGTDIYYNLQNLTAEENITAFPHGFRMIAGNNYQRNFTWPIPDPDESVILQNATLLSQFALQQRAVGFNCLHYNAADNEPSFYRHFLPEKSFIDANCYSGLRLELLFPGCWDGHSLDSPDHKSHMAYANNAMGTGPCPDDHPVRVPTLSFETIYATSEFQNKTGRFLLANGDPTGYGYHGDFVNGWDSVLLQDAVNTCTNRSGLIENCAVFNLTNEGSLNAAVALQGFDIPLPPAAVAEDCSGPRQGLCGNVPIESGPGYAAPQPTTTAATPQPTTVATEPTTAPTEPTIATTEPTTTSLVPMSTVAVAQSVFTTFVTATASSTTTVTVTPTVA